MDGRREWRLTRAAASVCAAALGLVAGGGAARASCLTLASGPVIVDVLGCKAIEPEKVFDFTKEKYSWIKDLDGPGRKKLLDSYRGLYVKTRVVKSTASTKGVTGEENVLTGQQVFMYIPPSAAQCTAVNGKRLDASLREICCDGGGDIPCLLETGYLLLQPKVIGGMGSAAGDETRTKARANKDYQAGAAAFKASKWKDAARDYEKARVNGALDTLGEYELGYAYRMLDQCADAVRPLRVIYDKSMKSQIWGDEEPIARKASFLLARCYSKMNDPGATVLILQGYLIEPEKYHSEIQQSLRHKDFGWIHTSKEYKDYEKEARKKLKK
jgi:hypothetical protein